MKILSHRGIWKHPDEKNSQTAFKRSFTQGFGTETDVRDLCGKLVISHDMPRGDEIVWDMFLDWHSKSPDLPLAVNIKSDGLAVPLMTIMSKALVQDWFVFDMSIPDMRAYLEVGAPVFTRMSEVERVPAWLEDSAGVWLDAFDSLWFDKGLILSLLQMEKKVCIVSPELHARAYQECWEMLKDISSNPNLYLCTDVPVIAKSFFEE